jgi:uncharacterized protein DUF6946
MAPRRIFTPSLGPSSWRAFLADSFAHWRRGKSAWELAIAWEAAARSRSGLPAEVTQALATSPTFRDVELIAAIPEHRVTLDDERRPSQNDLWLVLWTPRGYASVTVEAKAGEDFDKPIDQWLNQDSKGKDVRLRFLTKALGLVEPLPGHIRYQLVHRTASAILEGQRCHFHLALMLVQSFEESRTSWTDFETFATCLGLSASRGSVAGPRRVSGMDLYLAWVDSPKASDDVAASAV